MTSGPLGPFLLILDNLLLYWAIWSILKEHNNFLSIISELWLLIMSIVAIFVILWQEAGQIECCKAYFESTPKPIYSVCYKLLVLRCGPKYISTSPKWSPYWILWCTITDNPTEFCFKFKMLRYKESVFSSINGCCC